MQYTFLGIVLQDCPPRGSAEGRNTAVVKLVNFRSITLVLHYPCLMNDITSDITMVTQAVWLNLSTVISLRH